MIIRLIQQQIRYYLHYCITSEYIQNMIMDVQVGVSREGLSATKLSYFCIPIPPLAEQERIVAKIDELMSLCEALSDTKALDNYNAILAKPNIIQHKTSSPVEYSEDDYDMVVGFRSDNEEADEDELKELQEIADRYTK